MQQVQFVARLEAAFLWNDCHQISEDDILIGRTVWSFFQLLESEFFIRFFLSLDELLEQDVGPGSIRIV